MPLRPPLTTGLLPRSQDENSSLLDPIKAAQARKLVNLKWRVDVTMTTNVCTQPASLAALPCCARTFLLSSLVVAQHTRGTWTGCVVVCLV